MTSRPKGLRFARAVVRSIGLYLGIFIVTWPLGVIAIVGARFNRSGTVEWVIVTWCKIFLWLAGLTYEVEGREHLRPEVPQVVVSNHIGNMDAMTHYLALQPLRFRYMAKKELYQIPFFRTILKSVHVVKTDRRAGPGGYDDINRQIRKVFDYGYSLLVYAEGTRSRTGQMEPFKKGPFVIATDLGVPVLPVTIVGSDEAWVPGDWLVTGGHARIVIHPMIPVPGEGHDAMEELRAEVEKVIRTSYAELKGAA